MYKFHKFAEINNLTPQLVQDIKERGLDAGDWCVEVKLDGSNMQVAIDDTGTVHYVNNEFTIKYLDLKHRKDGYIELRPANKEFKPIRIHADDDFEVWGVVVWTIKNWRRY